MKIALCLSGLATRFNNHQTFKYAYEYFQEILLSKYDVDVFIHNWEPELESDLVNLYKPKLYIIEPQIDFYSLHKSIDVNKISEKQYPTIYSMLYSRKISIQLMNTYAKSNSISYDWVILTRNDGNTGGLNFNPNNNNNMIYFLIYPQSNAGPDDRSIYMTQKNALMIGSLFDYLPEYLSPNSNYIYLLTTGWPLSSPDIFSCEIHKEKKSDILHTIKASGAWNPHYLYKYYLYKNNMWDLDHITEVPPMPNQPPVAHGKYKNYPNYNGMLSTLFNKIPRFI